MSPAAFPPPEPLVDLEFGHGVLDRILCGLDSTPEGLEAVIQAGRLLEPGGSLDVLTALEARRGGRSRLVRLDRGQAARARGKAVLDAARAVVPDATYRVVEGEPTRSARRG